MQINFKPLFSYESLLMLLVIILTIIVLVLFHKHPMLVFLINLVLILGYFVISKRDDKKILLVTLIHFSLWGVLIESLIIRKTNLLEYKNKINNLNFPIWLFPAYGIFLLGGLYTYNLCKEVIKFE